MTVKIEQKLSINIFFDNIRDIHLIIAALELLRIHFQVRNEKYYQTVVKTKKRFKVFSKKYISELEKFMDGKITEIAVDEETLKSIEESVSNIKSSFASSLKASISEAIKEIIQFTSLLEKDFPSSQIHKEDITKIRSEILTTKNLLTSRD